MPERATGHAPATGFASRRPDHAYFTLHKIVSILPCGEACNTAQRQRGHSPQAVAVPQTLLGFHPCSQPYKNPASKQSPAPVVSTGSIALASWKQCRRPTLAPRRSCPASSPRDANPQLHRFKHSPRIFFSGHSFPFAFIGEKNNPPI